MHCEMTLDGATIEIAWTAISMLILVCIATPFALLYGLYTVISFCL